MALKDTFTKHVATSERPAKPELTTCYYRNDYQSVKRCVLEIAKKMQYQVENIDDHYKEIFLQGKKSHIIVSISALSYYEVAIDLEVYTYWTLSKKQGYQIIESFYQECGRKLNFKGKGLSG